MIGDISFDVLSWEESYNITLVLFEKMKRDGFIPDVILGIARGGWIPSRLFADFFKQRTTSNIKVEFYGKIGETYEKPLIVQYPGDEIKGKKILVVDDVADTGKSLKVVIDYLASIDGLEFKVVTLHYKPHSIVLPDYYFKETTDWIVFPWEYYEFIDEIIEKMGDTNNQIVIKDKLKDLGVPPGIVDSYYHNYA